MSEKTYLVFRANCIQNPEMIGNLEYCNRYHYPSQGSYLHPDIDHSIPYDKHHPAIAFENTLITDKKFNPRNQCKRGLFGTETVLTICKDGDDYTIKITYTDKTTKAPRTEDMWITEDFNFAWGITQDQIDKISKRLIAFYEEYFELKRRGQLSISYLTEKYLVNL